MQISKLDELESFTTLDGSSIRELVGPAWTQARNQSLAEALYSYTAGAGRMRLGEEEADVTAGDCVVIRPGTPHKLWNPGPEPLTLLCCCAPAYSHDDTVMTGR
jgi:mannose-6-phosphate isomerase-like protein (cupin superfamily)